MRRSLLLAALCMLSCDSAPDVVVLCDCAAPGLCDDAELVALPSGPLIQESGGAPDVVGAIDGRVTVDLDAETGEVALHFTRQTGEQVTYHYVIEETGSVIPDRW